jgi:hypothetical protein
MITLAVDYAGLMERNWEEIDIKVRKCTICGKVGVCKILKKGRLTIAVCENCFIDDTNRFCTFKKG